LKEGGYALKDLKGIKPTLEKLFAENSDEYASAMIDVFEAVSAPKFPPGVAKKKKVVKEIKHPGVMVQEIMKARNLTAEKLLSIIRISPEDFDRITACQMSIDDAMARELARTLGKTAREWVSMQKKYDEQKAKEE
jgi:addiction module HigA family antidote